MFAAAVPHDFHLDKFDQLFPTEESCAEYLYEVRWEDEYYCARCGTPGGYWLAKRKKVQCTARCCRHQTSVTSGTMFHNTKLSLRTWFKAIYLYRTSKKVTIDTFSEHLRIPHKTSWLLLQKISLAFELERVMLGNTIVPRVHMGTDRPGKDILSLDVLVRSWPRRVVLAELYNIHTDKYGLD